MFERIGIRGRLLIAFFGISALALPATVAALYAFEQVGDAITEISQQRVPSAIASLQLSRQAERVAMAASTVLAVTTSAQHAEVTGELAREMASLNGLLGSLKAASVKSASLTRIETSVAALSKNLDQLDDVVSARIEVAGQKQDLLRRLTNTTNASLRLVAAGVLVMNSKLPQWRSQIAKGGAPSDDLIAATADLAKAVAIALPQQKAQQEIAAISDTLLKAADAQTEGDLALIAFPLKRTIASLESLTNEIDERLRVRFRQRIDELKALIDGEGGIPATRTRELQILSSGSELVAENRKLSAALTQAVDDLVLSANQDIVSANQEISSIQRFGTGIVVGSTLLSLLCSGLVVWLYVDRSLLARLTRISHSMLAIAGGNLHAPLPKPGIDEIGRMAAALGQFRDTALEVEEKNLREVATARQRLVDAIESISEGFSLYDVDDRLVLCNSRYREIMYAGIADVISPGTPFDAIVRSAAERGLIADAKGREEEWIAKRIQQHQTPGDPHVQQRGDGRWVMISERRISGGGTVAVYSDITELKQREESLAEKSTALEVLSGKLAKYLAPQVYNSIFAGRQDVRITSHRKKLSVCFTDIAGFTETTDKMESEELTQILNHYLTEMSRIAMAHGATIDKYIGDAILMFFGDPDSRGVKEDAIACVTMALAMQKRMRSLAQIWRDAGIEKPFQCRIGIHTDYCTVGNFGSEDRMDYTIVGGAVNLASRLEHEAQPGSILVSFETFAQVKDVIHCEEQGQLKIRGLAYPIAVFRAVDLKENLELKSELVSTDLPHFQLKAEPALMTADERLEASQSLRKLLDELH